MKSKPNSKQKTISGTLIEEKIIPQIKSKCQFCKIKIFDLKKHESSCHLNPTTIPRTDYDWEYFEQFDMIRDFLIKNPTTKKMKKFNSILAPKGDPFKHIIDAMRPYMKKLPKNHLERQMYAKLDADISRGIEQRLLTEEEFIQRIEEQIEKGYQHSFLRDKPDNMSIKEWIDKISKISHK